MQLCDSNVLTGSSGLTLCACDGIQLIICSIYILTFIYYYIVVYSKLIKSFPSVDTFTITIYRILSAGAVIIAILSVLGVLLQGIFIISVLSVIIECISWSLCCYHIYLDVWYIPVWPTWSIKTYFSLETIFMLISSATQYNNNQTMNQLLISALSFIITVMLLIVSLFKDSVRDHDTVTKCTSERMIYSTDNISLNDPNSIRREPLLSDDSISNLSGSYFTSKTPSASTFTRPKTKGSYLSRLSSYFTRSEEANPYEAVDTNEYTQDTRFSRFFNYFGGSDDHRNASSQSLSYDIESRRYSPSDYSQKNANDKRTNSQIVEPLVKSALERHLNNGSTSGRTSKTFSSKSDPKDDSYSPRMSLASVSAGDRSSLSERSSGLEGRKSGALDRALSMQRARMNASNPGNVPRGATQQNPHLDSSNPTIMNSFDNTNDAEFHIIIQRWVLRQVLGHEAVEGSSSNGTMDQPSEPLEDDAKSHQSSSIDSMDELIPTNMSSTSNNVDTTAGNENLDQGDANDRTSPSTDPSKLLHSNCQTLELQFEICIHRGPEQHHHNFNSESEWLTSGKESSEGTSGKLRNVKRAGLWTLWKSSSDLFTLHTALVRPYDDYRSVDIDDVDDISIGEFVWRFGAATTEASMRGNPWTKHFLES